MTKIFEIESCEFCKYCINDPLDEEMPICIHPQWLGIFKDLKSEHLFVKLPDWCPLPDKRR